MIGIATALSAPILLAFATGLALGIRPELCWANEEFTSADWLAAPPEERYRYVKDLLDSDVLGGKSRAEVVQLLGPPSSAYGGRFSNYTVAYPYDFALTFDSVYFLRLEFDGTGRVARASLESD